MDCPRRDRRGSNSDNVVSLFTRPRRILDWSRTAP